MIEKKGIFKSYLMGGFECSTHLNHAGRRIDVISATRHDKFAEADYARMLEIGMKTARDGIRWHLIECEPYKYDFSSALAQIRAAEKTGIQIVWDLFHYGYPNDLNLMSEEFPVRFASFAEAFTRFLISETRRTPIMCPVNEISFFAWIAGKVGAFHPYKRKRGEQIKRQLVRSTILAMDAIRAVCPTTRFLQTDPAVSLLPTDNLGKFNRAAKLYHEAQFHAFDMLTGKREPQLGGDEKYLDVIGLNYYFNNQWRHPSGERILRGDADYRSFSLILQEFYNRYKRPILISETGIEDDARAEWFRYIYDEARIAASNGVQIEGICLYPIVNHPGWDDDRHCHNGLWDYADETGTREIYEPLGNEIKSRTNPENRKAQPADKKR